MCQKNVIKYYNLFKKDNDKLLREGLTKFVLLYALQH